MEILFDPVERSMETERIVMRNGSRLYYKFRPAPYYGGIATADAIGCSFLCAYCWNYSRNENPAGQGSFHGAQEVARVLLDMARQRHFRRFRVTGSEPILGEASLEHVMKIMRLIFKQRPGSIFILETNGLMFGRRPEFANRLKLENLAVRVCLKGVDPKSFEKISGAREEFFKFPLAGLRALQEAGIEAWPALMEDLFTADEIERFRDYLSGQGIQGDLELESLESYPFVMKNLQRRNVRFMTP